MPLNLQESVSATNIPSITSNCNSQSSGTDKWKNPNRAKAEAGGWTSSGSGCEIM